MTFRSEHWASQRRNATKTSKNFPADKDKQKVVAELVERMLKLTKQFTESRADFMELVNKYPRLSDVKFETYYRSMPTEGRQVLIQSNLKGVIKDVNVQRRWRVAHF